MVTRRLGRGRRRQSGGAGLDADENVLDQDRGDQDHADDADLRGAVDAGEPESVADVEHDQNRQRDTRDPPGTSEDRDAAEQHDRDHLEFESVGQVTASGSETRREQDSRQAGDERRRDEQRDADGIDLDPRVPGDVGVVTDHIDVATELAAVQDDGGDPEEGDEEQDRERQRAEQVVLAERVEPARIAADRTVLDENPRRPPPRDQPGERDDERRQLELGDHQPLEQTDARRDGQGDDEDQHERQAAALVERGHDAGREPHHGRNRQVDLAGDDHERHRDDDDHSRSTARTGSRSCRRRDTRPTARC